MKKDQGSYLKELQDRKIELESQLTTADQGTSAGTRDNPRLALL